VLDHLSGDNEIVSMLGRSLKEFWSWFLSGESECGEGVHDHVDPKELDGMEWGLTSDKR
jgi:hypothetical protein